MQHVIVIMLINDYAGQGNGTVDCYLVHVQDGQGGRDCEFFGNHLDLEDKIGNNLGVFFLFSASTLFMSFSSFWHGSFVALYKQRSP